MPGPPRVSVIIPTLNEATEIVGCLDALESERPDEVIVVDAGSPDGTAALAERPGVRVLDSPRGRGVQQNRGAAAATGDVYLFLHADCRLEPGALDCLRRHLAGSPRLLAGCFRMRVSDPDPRFRPIDAAARVRAGVFGLPYGDQALFARAEAFREVGGFPEYPLMDDLYFSIRMRRLGRFAVLPRRVEVSPRRWRQRGIARQTALNWTLTALAACGVPPDRLAPLYPAIRGPAARENPPERA